MSPPESFPASSAAPRAAVPRAEPAPRAAAPRTGPAAGPEAAGPDGAAAAAPESGSTRWGWLASLNPLNFFTLPEGKGPLAHAQRLVRDGHLAQAAMIYKSLLEQQPHDPAVLRGLSAILLRRGGRKNLQAGLEHMATAQHANPRDPANYMVTTLLYSRLGRPQEAGMERKKMAVVRTLQKNPENAAANNSMGVIFLRLNRPEDAIACFTLSIAARAGNDQAHRNLAKTYFVMARREENAARRGQLLDQARSEAGQALAIARTAASLIIEARLLILEGDIAAAEQRIAEAAKLEPKHPELAEARRSMVKAVEGGGQAAKGA